MSVNCINVRFIKKKKLDSYLLKPIRNLKMLELDLDFLKLINKSIPKNKNKAIRKILKTKYH